MADQLKRIADKLDGGDPNAGTPSEKGNLRRIADALDGGDPSIGTPSEEGNLKRIAYYIVENGIGGGGSGDLTTANVTIVNNTGSSFVSIDIPNCNTMFMGGGGIDIAFGDFAVGIETVRIEAILYKGRCTCYPSPDGIKFGTVSGNAEKMDDYSIIITGDCTLELVADDEDASVDSPPGNGGSRSTNV